MDRRTTVTEILSSEIAPFELRLVCDPAWLERFPGGFAPMPEVEEGNVLEVCPERIIEHGRALTDDLFVQFCEAIHVWQNESAMDFALQLPADLVVLKFVDDFPHESDTLKLIAAFVNLSLAEFLGAEVQ